MNRREVVGTAASFVHRVEHVDTDAAGVVHFSRYASLMESAALDLLEGSDAGLEALEAVNCELVISELAIRYLRAARYRDILVGLPVLKEVKGTQFRVAVSLSRPAVDGQYEILASGTLNFAVTDVGSGRVVPLPQSIRERLKETCVDA